MVDRDRVATCPGAAKAPSLICSNPPHDRYASYPICLFSLSLCLSAYHETKISVWEKGMFEQDVMCAARDLYPM